MSMLCNEQSHMFNLLRRCFDLRTATVPPRQSCPASWLDFALCWWMSGHRRSRLLRYKTFSPWLSDKTIIYFDFWNRKERTRIIQAVRIFHPQIDVSELFRYLPCRDVVKIGENRDLLQLGSFSHVILRFQMCAVHHLTWWNKRNKLN